MNCSVVQIGDLAAVAGSATAQHEIGGQVVFLECEDGNRKLKSFYEKNTNITQGEGQWKPSVSLLPFGVI